MRIAEGRAHKNGVDFWVLDDNNEKRVVITSKRNEDNTICVSIKAFLTLNKDDIKWRGIVLGIFAIYFLFLCLTCGIFKKTLLDNCFSGIDLLFVYINVSMIWLMYFLYIMLSNMKNDAALRYHTASHLFLNYYKVYKKLPRNLEELSKSTVYIRRCWYTKFPCFLLWISVSMIILFIINDVLLKILVILLFLFLIMNLWEKNYLFTRNQSALLYDSISEEEFEVVLAAMKEFENLNFWPKIKKMA